MTHGPGAYDRDTSLALSLWVVFSRSFNAMTRRAAADIRSHGFAPTEFAVLEYLYHKGPQPMARIGEAILVTSGNVTYVVDKLAGQGLVDRWPCEEDRRVVYAVLTDRGKARMSQVFPKHAARIKELLSVLGSEEQESLRALLKKLGHALDDPSL